MVLLSGVLRGCLFYVARAGVCYVETLKEKVVELALPVSFLLFASTRLIPVFLGHDREDEEADSNSPYLLRAGVDSNPQALPPAERRRLLTDEGSLSEASESARSESNAREAVAEGGGGSVGEKGGGGGAGGEATGTSMAVISTALDGEEDAVDGDGDGEVVVLTRTVSLAQSRRTPHLPCFLEPPGVENLGCFFCFHVSTCERPLRWRLRLCAVP